MERTENLLHQEREELFPALKNNLQEVVIGVMKAPTQTTIKATSDTIIDLVKEGVINPLQVAVMMKALTEVFENVKKNCTVDVLDELHKFTKDEVAESLGAKIERMETGVSYDFTSCGDIAWGSNDAKEKSAKDEKKEREAFLKSLKHSMAISDETTIGEMITVHPPIRKSTSTYKITLSK